LLPHSARALKTEVKFHTGLEKWPNIKLVWFMVEFQEALSDFAKQSGVDFV
jgi:hypothetical protein